MKTRIGYGIIIGVFFAMMGLLSCNRDDEAIPAFRVRAYVSDEIWWNEATLRGEIAYNEEVVPETCGFIYGTDRSAVLDRNAESVLCPGSDFEAVLTGLSPETVYYAAAFADQGSSRYYSPVVSFCTTRDFTLTVELATTPVEEAIIDRATLVAQVIDDGGVSICEKGAVYWKTSEAESEGTEVIYEVSPSEAPEPGELFRVEITGLEPDISYQARVWAGNGRDRIYTETVEIVTSEQVSPIVETRKYRYDDYFESVPGTDETNIGSDYVYLRGTVTSMGGAERLGAYGFRWGTTPDNLENEVPASDLDAVSGAFSVRIGDLASGTILWYAAYAANDAGMDVADVVSVATPAQTRSWKKDQDGFTTVEDPGTILLYWELDPIEVAGVCYVFLDRNLGARERVSDINATLYDGTNETQTQTPGMFDEVGDYYVFGNPCPILTIDAVFSTNQLNIEGIDPTVVTIADNIDSDGNWSVGQPCPTGYRIPTADEWRKIISKYGSYTDLTEQFTVVKTALRVSGTSFLRPPYKQNPTYQFPTNYNQYSTFLWSSTSNGTSDIGSFFHIGYATNYNTPSAISMDGFSNASVVGAAFPIRCVRIESANQ